ncbi:hypothetical protein [Bacillus paramycoides]|uniref:hypothetical protein n=1 Tax=Bacillus paramycoides TaxID=2026194 RepID=UPI002E1E0A6B|nr:hypothetical protein [Bacillus paramycoides]
MNEEVFEYDCRNCGHTVRSKYVMDGARCSECKSLSIHQRLTSNGIREDKIEHKDVLTALSKFSTKELVEALKLKEDVQIADTNEDTYKVSMDLMKVKKHVLVINNCNPQLVEPQRRVLEADMIRFADGQMAGSIGIWN